MTDCIEWTGHRIAFGHGRYTTGPHARKLAHRVAFEEACGPIPKGMCVLHRCDNPPCINPDHLFLGTRQENNRDRDKKGRGGSAKGEANGKAKLTTKGVCEIRRGTREGERQCDIAKRLGVNPRTVRSVQTGISWREVECDL